MALKSESWGRYAVVCDDPYWRGCREQIGPYLGRDRAVRIAEENKWYVSEATNKHSCPTCMGLHSMTIENKISNGSMTRNEADESGDPFTAAFIAMAFGGNPLTAGLTTMFTGSTSLGVIAGIMAGDHRALSEEKPFEGRGGTFGAAGVTSAFDAPPVIADPFETKETGVSVEASPSSSAEEKETEVVEHEDDPADTSQGTSY